MAGKIPQQTIDDVLTRTDIVEIISQRTTLRKAGREYSGLCPFHEERSPSFTVSPTKQFYHCFGCGAHGSAISFLMEHDNLSFIEAIEDLAKKVGVEIQTVHTGSPQPSLQPLYDTLADASRWYHEHLVNDQPKAAIHYIKTRGLTRETVQRFNIGYSPDSWDGLSKKLGNDKLTQDRLLTTGMLTENNNKIYDRFRGRLMFPIRDHRGRVIAFGGRIISDGNPKYLNSPETPLFHKGSELYGLYESLNSKKKMQRLLVVEGYMDAVILSQYGIEHVVAALGTATTPEHIKRLFRTTSDVIFCFDGDQAGLKAAWRALENTLPLLTDEKQVKFMFLPEGDDPDSMVSREGLTAFEQRINRATPLSSFFFEHICHDLDIRSIDGQAKLANIAKPLLGRLAPGIFRQKMLAKLADLIGMSVDDTQKHIGYSQTTKKKNALLKHHQTRSSQTTPMRLAIALILQKPSLASTMTDTDWLSDKIPGADILKKLLSTLKNNPNLNCAGIIENWRGSDIEKHLSKLAQLRLPIPEDGFEAEFNGALHQLRTQHISYRTQFLLDKSLNTPLGKEEKSELRELLQKKHAKT